MGWLAAFLQPILCWLEGFWCKAGDFFIQCMVEVIDIVVGLTAWIPIPVALSSFQWPDAGPLGGALIMFGFPEALVILSAAFTLRFLRGLIPFVRS